MPPLGCWGSENQRVQPLPSQGVGSGQKHLPQCCHHLEPAGGGGVDEPGLSVEVGGREASRAAGWPERVRGGEGTMPLQDDTLREVGASDRAGSPHIILPEPWGIQMEGLGRGRKQGGGRQTDSFVTLSGPEEEGRSPEVQQHTKPVCHPLLGSRWREPPTVNPGRTGGLGVGRFRQHPLRVAASLEVFVLLCFVFAGKGGA